jgi:hypothetical protein
VPANAGSGGMASKRAGRQVRHCTVRTYDGDSRVGSPRGEGDFVFVGSSPSTEPRPPDAPVHALVEDRPSSIAVGVSPEERDRLNQTFDAFEPEGSWSRIRSKAAMT